MSSRREPAAFFFGGKEKLPFERGGRGLLQRHNLYACPSGIICGRLSASRSLIKGLVSTARRGGLPFAPAKGSKTGSRGRFPLDEPPLVACSAGYERCKASSVLRTDTLPRSLRRFFIAPALERGRANHHPCPPPLRRGTKVQIKQITLEGVETLHKMRLRHLISVVASNATST